MINNIGDYNHITTAGTTQVVTGRCTLIRVVVNTTSTGTVTVVDGITTGTQSTVAILKASVAEQSFEYGVTMAFGLKVIGSGSSDLTVVYRVGA
jgi:hypothetical protein